MTHHATARLRVLVVFAVGGPVVSLAMGRPEAAVIALPFALALAAGLASTRAPEVGVAVAIDRARVLEDEEVRVEVMVTSDADVAVDVSLDVPAGLKAVSGELPASALLAAGEACAFATMLQLERWGVHHVGVVRVRAVDSWGLLSHVAVLDRRRAVRSYPQPEALRALVRPSVTRPSLGVHPSRRSGEGTEFADIRQWRPGDRMRAVNWRATARRGDLWVNDRHPDQSADVVLFLDSFEGTVVDRDRVLLIAVRAAAAVAAGHHRARDRLGLVGFGSSLRWLLPGSGVAHLYRLVDTLIDTEVAMTQAWRSVDRLPPRSLPARALVLALTPLADERAVTALLDLRARGFEVAVVHVVPHLHPGAGGDVAVLARRIYEQRRVAVRRRLQLAGIPIVAWEGSTPLEAAIHELQAIAQPRRWKATL